MREHPELSVGSQTEGVDVRSVGNSMVLEETALVEAFNLKAAIEFQMKNFDAAKEALSDMPPRAEEELDPVSLHNTALMRMEAEPSQGFRKLNFLVNNPPRIWTLHDTCLPLLTTPRLPLQVNNPPCPPETFPNLLLLYCKHQYYDLAADVLAENAHLTYEYLTGELYEFLDATLMVQVTAAHHTQPSAPSHHSARPAAR